MKDRDQLLAIFALTLSLGVPVLECFLQAIFSEENYKMSTGEHHRNVSSEQDLNDALSDPEVSHISLGTDIILYHDLVFNHDVTLDLNGCKLASLAANARVIDVAYGNVIITGKGSIVANGLGAAAVRIKGATTSDNFSYSSIVIDREVTLYAPNYYGLFVTPNYQAAYGVSVDFRGAMIARDGICINGNIRGKGNNAPHIKLSDGACITVDENDGIAIYASGYGNWQIGAVELFGATGVGAKMGKLTFQGTKIIATGNFTSLENWENNIESAGAAFEFDTTDDMDLEIKIKSGEYISRQSYTIIEGGWAHSASDSQKFTILDGKFEGAAGIFYGVTADEIEEQNVAVCGGNFNENIRNYLSSDFELEYDRSNRYYHVYGAAQEAVSPDPDAILFATESDLQTLFEDTKYYLDPEYAGKDLGDLQPDVDKALASLRRSHKHAEKILYSRAPRLEQIEGAIRRLNKSLANLQKIEDELRADILAVMASAREINPDDYSRYSYQILMESIEDADILLVQKQISLTELYSVFCDLNMNIDLLDDPDEDELFADDGGEIINSPDSILETSVEAESEVETESELPIEEMEDAEDFLQTATVLGAFALAETSVIDKDFLQARENLRTILNALTILNPSDYTLDSYQALHEIITSASALLNEPAENLNTNLLIATYNQVNTIYQNLVKKSHDPVTRAIDEARSNLGAMLEVAQNLKLSDYEESSAEQFGELQVAIAKAKIDLQNPSIALNEILQVMEEIQLATTGLKGAAAPPAQPAPAKEAPIATQPIIHQQATEPARPAAPVVVETQPAPILNWSALHEVIADISALEPSDYTNESYSRLLQQLEYTKSIANDPRLTQSIIDDIVFELNLSVLALVRINPRTAPNSIYEDTILNQTADQPKPLAPNLLMSMMAGAYAGIETYRRSRIAAKHRK